MMKEDNISLNKIITPVVTVFNNQELPDLEGNKKVIDFLIEGGVDGILVFGSTGEFTNLTAKDKENFFEFYSKYVNGRVELYAGTGSLNVKETIDLSNKVHSMGYVASVVIAPFYYAMNQKELFVYYDMVAKALDGNMMIYNFPARSGHSIAPSTVKKLVKNNDNIIGLKDSINEPSHTNAICLETKNYDFDIYSGFDDQFLYNISCGGKGSIGGLSNLIPEIWSNLVEASNRKDYEMSMKLSNLIHELMPLYSMDSNISLLFKELLVHRGIDISPRAIFPHNQIDENIKDKSIKLLDDVIKQFKNIKN